MTAAEREVSADWRTMLKAAEGRLPDVRHVWDQARRLGCACARELLIFTEDPRVEEALRFVEKAIASPSGRYGLGRARKLASAAEVRAFSPEAAPREWRAAAVVLETTREGAWQAAAGAANYLGADTDRDLWIAAAIRELLGNPFRPVALPAGWQRLNQGLLVRLARQARAERRFDALPVLADALEDAGCADEHLLGHCRSDNAHMPGCWVVELLSREG